MLQFDHIPIKNPRVKSPNFNIKNTKNYKFINLTTWVFAKSNIELWNLYTWIWRIVGVPEITQWYTQGWIKDLIFWVTLNIEATTIHVKTPNKIDTCHVGIDIMLSICSLFLVPFNFIKLKGSKKKVNHMINLWYLNWVFFLNII